MAVIRTIAIQAKLAWHATHSASSKRWIGVCDALNIATEASTLDELHSLIPESIDLLMRDLLIENELQRYLEDRGWSTSQPLPPDTDDVEFDVPWELVAEGSRDIQRSAH